MQHVVIVDDAETNLEILTEIVRSRPQTIAHAFTSSRDALAYVEEMPVDAFVLDYHMPPPNGGEMIRLLRSDPRFAYVPIVIITTERERANRLDALSNGANDYIERPVEPRELVARLETLLSLHAARERLSHNVSELEVSLREKEQYARAQADRMAALWRVVTQTELSSEDVPYAILFEGARAIRPPHDFIGSLFRVEGDSVLLEARAQTTGYRGELRVGQRVKIADTLFSATKDMQTPVAWADVLNDPAIRRIARVRRTQVRAAICVPFCAGRTNYVLMFWSRTAMTAPFVSEDYTYVELLANFFAARLQNAWHADRMSYQLSHDSLTGLRNRTQFRVDARAALGSLGGTVGVVALDSFRFVNETYGHMTGDALLVEVAATLQRGVREHEVIARLAGDTFGLFLPEIVDPHAARARIGEILAGFDRPFPTGDREGKNFVPLTATAGAAIARDGESIDVLLAHADTAVFAAKRSGRGRTLIYETGMESQEAARDRMLAELAIAIARNEFELFYQPHIDLRTMRVVGAEALIRWNHPTRGRLSPDEFIPFAEQHGSIRNISAWVMQSTLQAAEFFRTIDPAFRLFFNLSALDLVDMWIVDAFRSARESGVHLENVGVELTETAAMHDMGLTIQTVKLLREFGVRVALDDFGTGYSSLSLLKRLPVDVIKIDRTFVSEVLLGAQDAAITETVIAFGRRFGFETLGEGVETNDQLAWLAAKKCTYAQGYNIAHPQPLGIFAPWLRERTTQPA